MQIKISEQMANVVMDALRLHIARLGKTTYGFATDDEITNVEALEFFEQTHDHIRNS
jgi:hypothetical protein